MNKNKLPKPGEHFTYNEMEFIPCHDRCWWMLTPYTTPSSPDPWYAHTALFVYTDGTVRGDSAYGSLAVAPACLFNPKIFE